MALVQVLFSEPKITVNIAEWGETIETYLSWRRLRCRRLTIESAVKVWTSSKLPPFPPELLKVFGRVDRLGGCVVVDVCGCSTFERLACSMFSPDWSSMSLVSDWIFFWSTCRKTLLKFLVDFSSDAISLTDFVRISVCSVVVSNFAVVFSCSTTDLFSSFKGIVAAFDVWPVS